MQKVVRSAVAASIIVVGLALSAAPSWAHAAQPGQYKPPPYATTTTGVLVMPTGQGVDGNKGSVDGSKDSDGWLATTGADSADLALKGGALVIAGMFFVLLRRRNQHRTVAAPRA